MPHADTRTSSVGHLNARPLGKRRGILLRDAPWSKHVAGSVGGDSCFSGIARLMAHCCRIRGWRAVCLGFGAYNWQTDAALTLSYSSSSPLSSPLPPPRSTSTRGQTFIQTSPQLVSEIEDHVVGVVAGSRHSCRYRGQFGTSAFCVGRDWCSARRTRSRHGAREGRGTSLRQLSPVASVCCCLLMQRGRNSRPPYACLLRRAS